VIYEIEIRFPVGSGLKSIVGKAPGIFQHRTVKRLYEIMEQNVKKKGYAGDYEIVLKSKPQEELTKTKK